MKYYTGVGNRNTPADILEDMEQIARVFARLGWVLRSGGANGADSAFELGCDIENGLKEIYLPWKGFNNNNSPCYPPKQEAYDIAKSVNPIHNLLEMPIRLVGGI